MLIVNFYEIILAFIVLCNGQFICVTHVHVQRDVKVNNYRVRLGVYLKLTFRILCRLAYTGHMTLV